MPHCTGINALTFKPILRKLQYCASFPTTSQRSWPRKSAPGLSENHCQYGHLNKCPSKSSIYIWRQISVKTPRTTRSHLVVVHLVWFPNTMRIAVRFPNLMHDHEVRPRLTRYDLVSRGTTSSHKVRPRLTRSCIVLGNQTLPHFIGISNGMLLGKCVHTNCYSTLHHSMRNG